MKTVNVARLLYEFVTERDVVTLKIDVEGAEVDILGCLRHSPATKLIDTLIVEDHWQMVNNKKQRQQSRELVKSVVEQFRLQKINVILWD